MAEDKKSSFELGDPAWSEDVLRQAYFKDFIQTREVIRTNHPGAAVYEALESIRLSLDVFKNSVEETIASINKFKGDSSRPDFWNRPSRQIVDDLEISIQRGILSSSACAFSLVDHTRIFSRSYNIPNYDDKINEYFIANKQHHFFQSLRNYLSHFRIVKANWMIARSEKGRNVFFIMNKSDLMKWDGWNEFATEYIQDSKDGVNVEDLLEFYLVEVIEFHNWLRSAVIECYSENVSDYIRCIRLLNGFESKSHWDVILTQIAVPRKLDPYMYLDRYLMPEEVVKILSLPHRSKEQVDIIINIIDEYNICTEEMRMVVYKLFGVK
jgi:hypothetical protein